MGSNAEVLNRDENIAVFAKRFLTVLDIKEPTEKQIFLMRSFLQDTGVIFFRLSFVRNLTAQETACLFWVTRGKSIAQIAKILGIHRATVKTYFQRIKQKLNCTTMEQAVFEGIRYSYLQPKWRKK